MFAVIYKQTGWVVVWCLSRASAEEYVQRHAPTMQAKLEVKERRKREGEARQCLNEERRQSWTGRTE